MGEGLLGREKGRGERRKRKRKKEKRRKRERERKKERKFSGLFEFSKSNFILLSVFEMKFRFSVF